MKVYLIRHSEPTYEQPLQAGLTGFGRELGGLTPHGILLAQQRAHDPRLKQVQLLLASPYTRALQTALEIVRYNDIPLKVELGLREWQPDTSGRRTDTVEESGAAYVTYQKHPNQRPADSHRPYETVPELRARLLGVLKNYAPHYDCIACVCHGELIRQFQDWGDLDYCELREVTIN